MSEDAELQRIRAARLQQLAAQHAAGSSGRSFAGGSPGDDENKQAEDEARKSVLNQILTPEAVDRIGRIGLVNTTKARDVENRLIMMARSGQLRGRATEDDLVKLLGMLSEKERAEEKKVIFSRRKGGWDDEDDFD